MSTPTAAPRLISFTSSASTPLEKPARPAALAAAGWFADLLPLAQRAAGDPAELIKELKNHSAAPPAPTPDTTRTIWEGLASIAAYDLTVARALEPHLDAAAILAQAGQQWIPHTLWGVYAAESASPLLAQQASAAGTAWELNGPKQWCSLADEVTHAIVSAHTDEGRRTFAVRMDATHVQVEQAAWPSNGLAKIPSGGIQFTGMPASPVGDTGWYLSRPGFALGGVGVAAIWFGGAVGIFRTLQQAAQRREPDQLALSWLGEADRLLHTGACLLAQALQQVEVAAAENFSDLEFSWATALRIRGAIAQICERIIAISGHALGPAPLSKDPDHLRRVADLSVYIRQHHAARDDAALGAAILEQEQPTW